MIVAAAGNQVDAPDRPEPRFPVAEVGRVATEVGAALDRLAPAAVVVAAAAGADLLVAGAAAERKIPVHLVLPFAAERFRETSVSPAGPAWDERFDHALAGATTLVELDLLEDDDGYRSGNQAIVDRALALATGDGVSALVVRPPPDPDRPSLTDDLVDRAVAAGCATVVIDPRRPPRGR